MKSNSIDCSGWQLSWIWHFHSNLKSMDHILFLHGIFSSLTSFLFLVLQLVTTPHSFWNSLLFEFTPQFAPPLTTISCHPKCFPYRLFYCPISFIFIPARNREFFRGGEVFWNEGTLINISSTIHERKYPICKKGQGRPPPSLTPNDTRKKITNFQKRAREVSALPASCAPIIYHIIGKLLICIIIIIFFTKRFSWRLKN